MADSGSSVRGEHSDDVAALVAQYERIPDGAPVRLAKPTSNLFRFREDSRAPGLDVGRFDRVLEVDSAGGTAQVQGMATYERIVDALLPTGHIPKVVPQLKTITLGGAVAGLGIESTSYRNGLPHESVREMEILTGSGEVVRARPDNEHAELFRGFPNSYGTLGYSLRLEIELERVKPYVELRHVPLRTARECADAIAAVCAEGAFDGRRVDFVDGTVFSAGEHYLTLGSYVDEAPFVSDYTGQRVYYRSMQEIGRDYLTIHDYLWRWDTDWFWCSRALGAQHPLVRRFWPRRYKRSDVYRRVVAWDRKHSLTDRLAVLRGGGVNEPVIQDVEIPVDRLPEFLEFFHREIGISPIWLCPVRLRDEQGWPLYPMDPETLYVNLGFWATVPLELGELPGRHNRAIERAVAELDGHKSLYSNAYYTEDEFWRLYNLPAYEELKSRYDPKGRLPGLYEKCVREK
ncbi:FAD-binding oxidoreductase [Saccharopolyspora griseoalba]|uniref:Delta(24)-sterol reductase n=1 Tax=Saccharopolyspora griseoalba TaxID=1431848 RepID=A0ABW2LQ68_9PSEU